MCRRIILIHGKTEFKDIADITGFAVRWKRWVGYLRGRNKGDKLYEFTTITLARLFLPHDHNEPQDSITGTIFKDLKFFLK
jgi:hypothetical protein